MNRSTLAGLVLGGVVLVMGGCGDGSELAGGRPEKLVLGLVPALEADKLIDNLKPLDEYLTRELGVAVESFVPQDYTGLIEALGSGQADIAMLPPFAGMLALERYGVETILISVRDGEARYRAQWMTADPAFCDEPPAPRPNGLLACAASIQKVRGKVVGFTDPTSTSGYLFPALQLIEAGINPEEDIQSVFVGSHDAAVIALLNGDVEVAAAYDDARTYILEEYPDIGSRVLPFAYSDWIPNDGVQVRGDLPTDVKESIKQAFLDLAREEEEIPQEERLMYRLYEIDGFVEFEPGTYDPVKRAFTEMRDKIDLDE
ncbi:MAG: phosphate/phosphite/phosphonate ABC transporter substrate-binding protein [Acidobacteriota bacterium]|nr:phosphate/phosphite/phosphonate ABC transporter substrate-binding protein [Acidobacteriota bacterium]MDH3525492.1 phosphate/phosphite/phosphonate ABC transporter substrate-binding protein [Acidobacteriota bacterium]